MCHSKFAQNQEVPYIRQVMQACGQLKTAQDKLYTTIVSKKCINVGTNKTIFDIVHTC